MVLPCRRDPVCSGSRAGLIGQRRKVIVPRATWNGAVLADAPAGAVELVEGNVYFPIDAVNRDYLVPSETHTVCGWKGTCSYYDVRVGGEVNKDAAWYYPEPKDAARTIAGRVAFWRGVQVER
jgi:uncharacterized protein (DUF427 family)